MRRNFLRTEKSRISCLGFWLLTFFSVVATFFPSGAQAKLVLWNRLGSLRQIKNSVVGPGGVVGGEISFGPGVFGRAYIADQTTASSVSFPREVIPIGAGTIEFYGKLVGFPANIGTGQRPYFVSLVHENPVHGAYEIGFNSNDGAGNGGLVGNAGTGFYTGTGSFGSWTYEQVLGIGKQEDWHITL
ncbi:hypothetical protein HYR99_35895 [Candidatus Poribacteria bacterium]|nr:hypothetical protein [Candidatus Poribacteria bacterium]